MLLDGGARTEAPERQKGSDAVGLEHLTARASIGVPLDKKRLESRGMKSV